MTDEGLGRRLPDLKTRPPGSVSRSLARTLSGVESRNVTFVDPDWPVFWEQARGANVEDADGNVYVDLTGAFGVAFLGHGHPGVVAAVQAQAGTLLHGMGDVHPPAVKARFLERLAGVLPLEDPRIVLASTGSEAVEAALKTTLLATGRPGVLALEGAYHGLTLGALGVTHRELFRGPFGERLPGDVVFAPFPDPVRLGSEAACHSLEWIEEALSRGTAEGVPIGTVIVEPVQGRAGVRLAPHGFMEKLSGLAREAGALVVADEIFTGMGRCGSLVASERVGLRPDVICLGKALGGGVPLSACVARREVMDAWPPSDGEAIHTSTFLGHPLACAAGLAVLDALEAEGAVERARTLGGRMVADLRAGLAGLPGVADVRGLGLMIGIELARGPLAEASEGAAVRVAQAALREGLLVLPAGASGHVVELTPPVELTDAQAEYAVEVLVRLVEEVAG